MPVKGEELDPESLVQFPAIVGGTVPVINLAGFEPGRIACHRPGIG